MTIVVLRELRQEPAADLGSGDALARVAAVHAAPADQHTPGDVGDRTFCGKPTPDMERLHYPPAEPAASWLPPAMRQWECPDCADALRSP